MRNTLIITLAILAQTAFSQSKSNIEFALVALNGSWSLIDKQGNYILNQEYDLGSYDPFSFEDELAISSEKGKFGFVDFSGKQIIPNSFNAVRSFQLGYAAVSFGYKWGIINKYGKYVVEPTYDCIGNFGAERVAGVIKDGKIALIDTTGKVISPFRYTWKMPFSDHPDYPYIFPSYPIFFNGLITVVDEKTIGRKQGCLNTKGKLVIPAIYDNISGFYNGYATARKDGNVIIIDTLGRKVFELKNTNSVLPLYFMNGIAVFHNAGGGTGLINIKGKVILEPKYEDVNQFSEGYAAVRIGPDEKGGVKSGFIDTTGKFVFNRSFGSIRSFKEGFAAVEINGKWGFIDKTGNTFIKPEYFTVSDFNDGLALVGLGNDGKVNFGCIDKTGKYIINPTREYIIASSFQCGLAPVKIGDKYGYIDTAGKIVIPPKFDNALEFQKRILGSQK